MSDVEKYADNFKKIGKLITEFKKEIISITGGSFEWTLDEVTDSFLSLFDRFCPYKVGDHVQLKKDVDVSKSPGWQSSAHFLKQGATAVVKERGCSNGQFTFHIVFDKESWIDLEGVVRLVAEDDKHQYHFGEKALEPYYIRS